MKLNSIEMLKYKIFLDTAYDLDSANFPEVDIKNPDIIKKQKKIFPLCPVNKASAQNIFSDYINEIKPFIYTGNKN